MNDAAIPVARRTARRNTGSFMCWGGPLIWVGSLDGRDFQTRALRYFLSVQEGGSE